MAQVTLENTRAGGFGLPTGQVVPGGGSITVEPEVWKEAKDHPVVKAMVENGQLVVDGKGRKKSGASEDDRDENGDTAEMAEMRRRFDASFSALSTELEAEKAKTADLEQQLAARVSEIDALKATSTPAPMKAEHHGGGKFNVTRGEETLASGLTKADADAFNAMSDADKLAFVQSRKG